MALELRTLPCVTGRIALIDVSNVRRASVRPHAPNISFESAVTSNEDDVSGVTIDFYVVGDEHKKCNIPDENQMNEDKHPSCEQALTDDAMASSVNESEDRRHF